MCKKTFYKNNFPRHIDEKVTPCNININMRTIFYSDCSRYRKREFRNDYSGCRVFHVTISTRHISKIRRKTFGLAILVFE